MKRLLSTLLFGLLAACGDAGMDPLVPEGPSENSDAMAPGLTPQASPNDWIVVFRPGVADPPGLARRLVNQAGGNLRFTYRHTIQGFAATLPPQALEGIRRNPNVLRVVPDGIATVVAEEPAGSWGIDRIDQRALPLSGTYVYETDGSGVTAYILDTGIRTSHVDFGGRAFKSAEADFLGGTGDDCHGHGTHVAGILGGDTYGVAKGVTLQSVRVLGCEGSGAISGVIAGIDWVTGQHLATGGPSVANMSLSAPDPFGWFQDLNNAVAASVEAGVVFAVAASNDDDDACGYVPASEPQALTVGSVNSSDTRASDSNYGYCLDLFAPGVGITSAFYTADDATKTWSGTSMASPHVAGVAALYLGTDPDANHVTVKFHIITKSTQGVVLDRGPGSPDKLLYSLITVDPPPDPDPPAAPTDLTATALSPAQIDLAWTDNAGNETGFQVERSDDGTTFAPHATVGANVSAYSDTGLPPATTFHYRVRATNTGGESGYSNSADATTHPALEPPAAPTNLTAAAISETQIDLAWTDNSTDEEGFEVERSGDGITFGLHAEVGPNDTEYSDTGLSAGSTWHYRVRAKNAAGPSGYTNIADATTDPPPSGDILAEVWEVSEPSITPARKFLYAITGVAVREKGSLLTLLDGVTVIGDWYWSNGSSPVGTSTGITEGGGLALLESGKIKDVPGATLIFCVTALSGDGFVDETEYPKCSDPAFTPPDPGDPGDPGTPGAPSGLTASFSQKGGGRVELAWTPGGGAEVDVFRLGAYLTTTADNGRYNDKTGASGMSYQVCIAGAGNGDPANCSNTAAVAGGG